MEMTIELDLPGADDAVECTVEFTYSRGYPETGPSYSSGGEPGEPPSVDIERVTRNDTEEEIQFDDLSDSQRDKIETQAIEEAKEDIRNGGYSE